ncbi:MAG: CBS domain-containing protein [Pseudomonadales bacterium]
MPTQTRQVQPQRVRDYMTRTPFTVPPDMEIMRAVGLLVTEDLSGFPVVNDAGELLGMLTERDIIRVGIQAGYFDEIVGSVGDYMTRELETVHPDESLIDVAERFVTSSHRRFPVVEDGRLVGLLCRRDVLRALTDSAWFPGRGGE